MKTNGIAYSRHIYHKTKLYKENIIGFEQVKNNFHKSILPAKVKLEKLGDKLELIFCLQNPAIWKFGNRISELSQTRLKNVFEGNLITLERKLPEPGSLIFCEVASNEKILVVDVFSKFYTQNPFVYNLLLENHEFLLRKKPGSK